MPPVRITAGQSTATTRTETQDISEAGHSTAPMLLGMDDPIETVHAFPMDRRESSL